MSEHPAIDIGGSEHGTHSGYALKCRCDPCRQARREYDQERLRAQSKQAARQQRFGPGLHRCCGTPETEDSFHTAGNCSGMGRLACTLCGTPQRDHAPGEWCYLIGAR